MGVSVESGSFYGWGLPKIPGKPGWQFFRGQSSSLNLCRRRGLSQMERSSENIQPSLLWNLPVSHSLAGQCQGCVRITVIPAGAWLLCLPPTEKTSWPCLPPLGSGDGTMCDQHLGLICFAIQPSPAMNLATLGTLWGPAGQRLWDIRETHHEKLIMRTVAAARWLPAGHSVFLILVRKEADKH